VIALDGNDDPIGQGSGFVTTDGYVVTNHHVVEHSVRTMIRAVGTDDIFVVDAVVAESRKNDLSLLSVKGLNLPGLTIARDAGPSIADTIYAVGNPLGAEGTFSEGIVSSLRKNITPSQIQFTAPISPGSSGGPLLNEQGEVVGIVTQQIIGGQNLNFAVAVSHYDELLGGIKSGLNAPNPKFRGIVRSKPAKKESPMEPGQLLTLGLAYLTGKGGLEQDIERGVRYLEEVKGKAGGLAYDVLSMYYCGYNYGDGGDFEKGIEYLKVAAEMGSASSQAFLSTHYFSGTGMETDLDAAYEWALKAATQGDELGARVLGEMFLNGLGISADHAAALKWFELAASGDLDDGASEFRLFQMYRQGLGTPVDDAKALKWSKAGAELGHAMCLSELGRMYFVGSHGVERDFALASSYLMKAADHETDPQPPAQATLGHMYLNGRGLPQDDGMAYFWLSIAVANGMEPVEEVLEKATARLTPERRASEDKLIRKWLAKH